jgi:glutaredoxin-related protein
MEGVEVPALLIEDNGDIVLVLYDTGLDKVLKIELVVVTMEGVGVPALLTEDIGDIVLCCHHGMYCMILSLTECSK